MFGTRKQLNELPIPAEAQTDENSRELIRAWAAHKGFALYPQRKQLGRQ
jgi:hypothetical protein